jgi:multidrug resistance efflux pump
MTDVESGIGFEVVLLAVCLFGVVWYGLVWCESTREANVNGTVMVPVEPKVDPTVKCCDVDGWYHPCLIENRKQ